jgi:hypothetical protein
MPADASVDECAGADVGGGGGHGAGFVGGDEGGDVADVFERAARRCRCLPARAATTSEEDLGALARVDELAQDVDVGR